MNCVTLTDMQSGAPVLLPAVLQMPHIPLTGKACMQAELSFLNKYSSNSGIAFGCSRPEALLHGLNEVVERHVLSKIFMSLCGQHE
ncbi:YcaO-like family protein, partial [Pseudomonas viridiflava]|uniref:YcaO-like family protein n=1 Tax=Pseudomonas viridiflava TaxID=33069 RepID=UPI002406F407